MMNILTKEELLANNFTYHEMTVEYDFQYDYWTLEKSGLKIEITNEYDLKGKVLGQMWEINDVMLQKLSRKDLILQLIKILDTLT